jgi:hypothetical protein
LAAGCTSIEAGSTILSFYDDNISAVALTIVTFSCTTISASLAIRIAGLAGAAERREAWDACNRVRGISRRASKGILVDTTEAEDSSEDAGSFTASADINVLVGTGEAV